MASARESIFFCTGNANKIVEMRHILGLDNCDEAEGPSDFDAENQNWRAERQQQEKQIGVRRHLPGAASPAGLAQPSPSLGDEGGGRLGQFFRLEAIDVDVVEIQAADEEEVGRHKCKEAFEKLRRPVVVEDTSLAFNALKGLPGPFVKWFEQKLGNEGLKQLLAGFEDKTAYAVCTVCFCDGQGEPRSFVGRTKGTIVAPRGDRGFGW
eukprot:GHVT01021579.1.p2 GENE.GHVT01021579.1~~GHVT01021579.1.p2  ORF type:complete len:222 (-),score=54.82 GHVT01021579.1:899-1525(-)